jgi:hypothetical protein
MSEVKECPKCKDIDIQQVDEPLEVKRHDGTRECFIFTYKCLTCECNFAAFYGVGSRDVLNKLSARAKKESDE